MKETYRSRSETYYSKLKKKKELNYLKKLFSLKSLGPAKNFICVVKISLIVYSAAVVADSLFSLYLNFAFVLGRKNTLTTLN